MHGRGDREIAVDTERLFLAVALPERVRERLAAYVRPAAKRADRVRWAPSENLHVTLKFLGETNAENKAAVLDAMARVVAKTATFAVSVSGLRVVRRRRRPHMVWGLVADGDGRLRRLHGRTERLLAQSGLPRDGRSFSPHITLARVRQGIAPWETELLEDWAAAHDDFDAMPFTVDQVTLMRSDLGTGAPVYTVCRKFPLRTL